VRGCVFGIQTAEEVADDSRKLLSHRKCDKNEKQ
jgi:hypothetical protein